MNDFDNYRSQLLYQSKTLLPSWLSSGKWEGDEWSALNPTRSDKNRGSFKVNSKTGEWSDYATGDRGTNLLDLYAYIHSISVSEAYNQLTGNAPAATTILPTQPPKEIKEKPQPIMPPAPASIDLINSKRPESVYEYRTTEGELMGYVLRLPKRGGGKIPLPLFYFEDGGWQTKGFTGKAKRPLYGLEKLAQNPTAKVLLVEGEKCADYANRVLSSKWVALGWLGGSGVAKAKKIDLKPLEGREVYLWPDNDNDGFEAMQSIATVITAAFLKPLEGKPEGWDIADATDDELEEVMAQAHKKVDGKPSYDPFLDNDHYTYLGYNFSEDSSSVEHNFYVKGYESIMRLKSSQFTIGRLVEVADEGFWDVYRRWNGDKPESKETWMANIASNFKKAAKGCYYNMSMVRGVGVWPEPQSPTGYVFHVGDRVIAGSETIPFGVAKSGYIYTRDSQIPISSIPASTKATRDLVDIIKLASWSKPTSALLFAGWLFIAPIAGVLKWRPHIYLYGPAGSGKTTVQGLISQVLSGFIIANKGKSTEPGIRGSVGNSTKPVLLDEAEDYGKQDRARLDSILNFIRGSSSGRDEATVVKGTATGGFKRYVCNSVFCLASINPCLDETADKERFIQLSMTTKDPQRAKKWEKLQTLKADFDYNHPDFAAGLRRRAYDKIPQLLELIKRFEKALSTKTDKDRLGEHIAALLAGFSFMIDDNQPNDEAIQWMVDSIDLDESLEDTQGNEYDTLLNYLVRYQLRFIGDEDGKNRILTVGEMIFEASGKIQPHRKSGNERAYKKILARNGIKVEEDYTYIANSSNELETIFRGTLGGKNWNKILLNVPNAVKGEAKRFNIQGLPPTQRTVGIPTDTLITFTRNAGLLDEDDEITPPVAPVVNPYSGSYKIEEDPPF